MKLTPPPVELDPADSVLIGKAIVTARCNLTFTSIWRLMQEGKFPRARTVGNKVVWLKSDIDRWIDETANSLRRYKNNVDGTRPPSYHNAKARSLAKKKVKVKS